MINALIITVLLAIGMPAQPVPSVPHCDSYTPAIVYRSGDDGWSWESADIGLPPDVQVEYVETLGDFVFLGTENRGMFRKNIHTGNWEPIGMLTFAINEKITGLYAIGTDLFACIYRAGFYKSPDYGMTWVPMHNTLEDKSVRAVLRQGKRLLVGTDTGIFSSSDEGESWKKVFQQGQVTTLVESKGVLFGGTFRGLIRSKNGGKHWDWVLQEGAVHKTKVFGHQVVALNMSGRVMASGDGGQLWQNAGAGLPEEKDVFDMVRIGPFYVCSHLDGIYRTTALNGYWEQVLETPGEKILDLTVAQEDVYAGTVRRN